MSNNPHKRRRFDPSQSVDFQTMTMITNIIIKLNLNQYNHILFDWINGKYNNNMDVICVILNKYSLSNASFINCLCGVDYLQTNIDLFHRINVDYNQNQDALKIYHKQHNHIIATYSKDQECNKKQLVIQSSVYVFIHLIFK